MHCPGQFAMQLLLLPTCMVLPGRAEGVPGAQAPHLEQPDGAGGVGAVAALPWLRVSPQAAGQ